MTRTSHSAALSVALAALFIASPALAANENTTILFHAVDLVLAPCNQADLDGVDCESTLPVTDLSGMQTACVLVLLRNYDSVWGVQCAFEVPDSWAFGFGLWDCLTSLYELPPGPPWGPVRGSLTLPFDQVVTGGALVAFGRMTFYAVDQGCIEIIESAFPNGTHVLSPTFEVTPIPPSSRGRACVGPGGHDACYPLAPVTPVTWGRIKSQY